MDALVLKRLSIKLLNILQLLAWNVHAEDRGCWRNEWRKEEFSAEITKAYVLSDMAVSKTLAINSVLAQLITRQDFNEFFILRNRFAVRLVL